ncbi:hypothetical protein DNL40_03965 [Xylanimonas oleitrophica]|uniref:Secreted protein n=2 Tax=Xylanimonas oleitrophica TaxID=2607479 RepID=A0A2W5WU08_9MICO|nr:hypothetical protein DNL40_03965 [Xylanimonas oleitrophica]
MAAGCVAALLGVAWAAVAQAEPESGAVSEEPAFAGTNGEYIEADSPEEAVRVYEQSRRGGAAVQATYEKAPCKLTTQHMHTRTSGNKKTIGHKPTTACSVRVSKITHGNSADYRWGPGLWVAAHTQVASRNNLSKWTQTDFEFTCGKIPSENTSWVGWTAGTVLWNGKNYHSIISTPQAELKCKP